MQNIIANIKKIALGLAVMGLAIGFSAFRTASETQNLASRYWVNIGNSQYVELQGTPDYSKCGIPDSLPCILTSDDDTVPSAFTEDERIENGYDVTPDAMAEEAIYN